MLPCISFCIPNFVNLIPLDHISCLVDLSLTNRISMQLLRDSDDFQQTLNEMDTKVNTGYQACNCEHYPELFLVEKLSMHQLLNLGEVRRDEWIRIR